MHVSHGARLISYSTFLSLGRVTLLYEGLTVSNITDYISRYVDNSLQKLSGVSIMYKIQITFEN